MPRVDERAVDMLLGICFDIVMDAHDCDLFKAKRIIEGRILKVVDDRWRKAHLGSRS